jgi:hypothetical protein
MKNTETYKVIILPTTNRTSKLWYDNKDKKHLFDPVGTKDATPQHLYAISDEEIKEGVDYYYDSHNNLILKSSNNSDHKVYGYKKIIATTDKSLGLPIFEQSFIKHYAEVGGIDEVELEMEKIPYMEQPSIGPWEYYYKLKLTDNNEVVVVEEVDYTNEKRELLLAYHRYLVEELNMDLEEIWVDEFLKANNYG